MSEKIPVTEGVMNLNLSKERVAGVFFLRFLLPNLFFIPLVVFGFSIPGLIATILVRSFIAQQIELMYKDEFTFIYYLRSIIARNKANG